MPRRWKLRRWGICRRTRPNNTIWKEWPAIDIARHEIPCSAFSSYWGSTMNKQILMLIAFGVGGLAAGGAALMLRSTSTNVAPALLAAVPGTKITLPFSPPVGVPIRYEQQLTAADEFANVRTSGPMTLTFVNAAAGGYVMRWETEASSAESSAEGDLGIKVTAPASVVVVAVSHSGTVTGLVNMAEVRAADSKPIKIDSMKRVEPDSDAAGWTTAFMAVMQQRAADERKKTPDSQIAAGIIESASQLLPQLGLLTVGVPRLGNDTLPENIATTAKQYPTQTLLTRYVPGHSADIVITSLAEDPDAKPAPGAGPGPAPIFRAPQSVPLKPDKNAPLKAPIITVETRLNIELPSGLVNEMTRKMVILQPEDKRPHVETYHYKRISSPS